MIPFHTTPSSQDEWLFGWDPLPGIVSVWANHRGSAILWRRENERILCTTEHFRPWLFATTLADLPQFASASQAPPTKDITTFSYRELDRSASSYRYLLSARDGR